MRKVLGSVLTVVGSFLVVLAVLAQFYAPARLMKTPLDVNSTTRLSGQATLYAAGKGDTFPVKAVSITRADSAKSDGNVVAFANSTCLVKDEGDAPDCVSSDDPQNRLVSASTDSFATNRSTAVSVNDPQYLPGDATRHAGLINKFPFETADKTYPFWDGMTSSTEEAKLVGKKRINGLQTWAFNIQVKDAPIEIADGVPGTYSDDKTMYIEPLTGSIIDQKEKQVRATADGKPVLDLSIAFVPDTVAANVKDAKANVAKLNLISNVVPLVGYIVGIPLLLVGLFMVARGKRRES